MNLSVIIPIISLIFAVMFALYLFELLGKLMKETDAKKRKKEQHEIFIIAVLVIFVGAIFLTTGGDFLILGIVMIGAGIAPFIYLAISKTKKSEK